MSRTNTSGCNLRSSPAPRAVHPRPVPLGRAPPPAAPTPPLWKGRVGLVPVICLPRLVHSRRQDPTPHRAAFAPSVRTPRPAPTPCAFAVLRAVRGRHGRTGLSSNRRRSTSPHLAVLATPHRARAAHAPPAPRVRSRASRPRLSAPPSADPRTGELWCRPNSRGTAHRRPIPRAGSTPTTTATSPARRPISPRATVSSRRRAAPPSGHRPPRRITQGMKCCFQLLSNMCVQETVKT